MENKDAQYWLNKGNEYSDAEKFEEAINCYLSCIIHKTKEKVL